MDASFFDDVDLKRPFTWENQAFGNSVSGLPTILVFSDSYFNDNRNIFIGKYLAQHFDKTILILYDQMYNFEQYINKYKPDMVVFESAERMLDGFSWVVCYALPALSD
jgi:hypothetical protein